MAIDIIKANTSNPIKHYTVVTKTPGGATVGYVVQNNSVKNTPVIADIESKYSARFKL